MNPRASIPSLLLIFLLASCTAVRHATFSPVELVILHWNDFHAQNMPFEVSAKDSTTGETVRWQVGGSANFAAYLNAHGRGRDNVLVMNAGDDFQGSPISSITQGWSQIELMNLINPDAMVLGNHEFDYGTDTLRHYLKHVRFPLLGANLYDSATGRSFADPFVVRNAGPIRVGIIGLLPPDIEILTLKGNLKGMAVLNMDSVLNIYIPYLKRQEQVDLIVIVSHMGVHQDTLLALRRNDIDVIVGGHSHTPLFEPIKKGRTVVVQAGSRGRYMGKLTLSVDPVGDSVLSYAGRLVETRLGVHTPDPAIASVVERFETLVDTELSAVIGNLETAWTRSWSSESNVGNFIADAYRSFAGTDIAFMNSGGIRKDIETGPVTKRDIWEISPFGNTLVTFSVTGEALREMMEWQASRKGELMQVSGLTYVFNPARPQGSRLQSLLVADKPVDPERHYTITTNNYVAGHAQSLFGPSCAEITTTDLHAVDREVLMDAISRAGTIHSRVEGRIRELLPHPSMEN